MKIQYASDLHLEFTQNSSFLEQNPIIPNADILVLAGDIGYLNHETYTTHPFWDWASVNFKQVLVVPGNHEFYNGYDLFNLKEGMQVEIRPNIHWYYNKSIVIDDIEFILTPLWSFITTDSEYIISRRLADFRYSVYNKKPLSIDMYNRLHSLCVTFLMDALYKNKTEIKIIVSHHAPSYMCIADEFKGSVLNSAFYSDLNKLIELGTPDYWIYGHSHRNIEKVIIGKTSLVCNQLGYISHKENLTFQRDRQITI